MDLEDLQVVEVQREQDTGQGQTVDAGSGQVRSAELFIQRQKSQYRQGGVKRQSEKCQWNAPYLGVGAGEHRVAFGIEKANGIDVLIVDIGQIAGNAHAGQSQQRYRQPYSQRFIPHFFVHFSL